VKPFKQANTRRADCWDCYNYGNEQRVRNPHPRSRDSRNAFRQEKEIIPSLDILHTCFYFPRHEDVKTLSRGAIRKACRQITMVFTARFGRNELAVQDLLNVISSRGPFLHKAKLLMLSAGSLLYAG
jgi:hypothetical protein